MRVIYQIRNIHNEKVYVGSAQDVDRRWRKHREALKRGDHHNSHLQNAWNKEGKDAFVFEVLEEVLSDEDLIPTEQKWIDKKVAFDRERGYNKSPTAGSPLGVKQSEETRRKKSEAFRGEKHPFWGKTLTKEHREKISRSNKGKAAWNKGKTGHLSPEQLKEMSERMSGEKHPCWGKERGEETRRKISDTLKGHEVSEETREKLRKANTGKKLDEETKKKISVANRRANRARSHLNEDDVKEIRRLCESREKSQTEIAKMFGVSQSTISAIKAGRLWKE